MKWKKNNVWITNKIILWIRLQEKENIIKEVREYIETINEYGIGINAKKELLEILDKGE